METQYDSSNAAQQITDSDLKLNKLMLDFGNFHKEFDARISELNFRLMAVDDKVKATDHSLKTHFIQYKTKLQKNQ